jgi:hypothetical protein
MWASLAVGTLPDADRAAELVLDLSRDLAAFCERGAKVVRLRRARA